MVLVFMAIKNQLGTTLIELLVAIAIIGIMSGIFVAQISLTDGEELNLVTERVAADLKQIRNLATSRGINENNVYPAGGYGIYFQDYDVLVIQLIIFYMLIVERLVISQLTM